MRRCAVHRNILSLTSSSSMHSLHFFYWFYRIICPTLLHALPLLPVESPSATRSWIFLRERSLRPVPSSPALMGEFYPLMSFLASINRLLCVLTTSHPPWLPYSRCPSTVVNTVVVDDEECSTAGRGFLGYSTYDGEAKCSCSAVGSPLLHRTSIHRLPITMCASGRGRLYRLSKSCQRSRSLHVRCRFIPFPLTPLSSL